MRPNTTSSLTTAKCLRKTRTNSTSQKRQSLWSLSPVVALKILPPQYPFPGLLVGRDDCPGWRFPKQAVDCNHEGCWCPLEEILGITEANIGMENILFSSLKRPSKSRITEIGGEDKDTQREKVKDRRRRLERPASLQLNKVNRKAD